MELNNNVPCVQRPVSSDFIGLKVEELKPPPCILDVNDPGSCLQLQIFVQNILLDLRTNNETA